MALVMHVIMDSDITSGDHSTAQEPGGHQRRAALRAPTVFVFTVRQAIAIVVEVIVAESLRAGVGGEAVAVLAVHEAVGVVVDPIFT